MSDLLKTFFSPALVRQLADSIARVFPTFSSEAFVARASSGLGALELIDRARHIANALAAHLPPDYPNAIDVLLRSLGPEHQTDELIGLGMAPFFYMPHVLFVAERGIDHFDLSIRAQYELTKRFSAESSIRSYIAHDPERTFSVLRKWSGDPNAHVRRLVSEGTRLRLPWAMRVAWLDRNPRRVIDLLERLKDDPTTLVRRSVANNLNDLGKVQPKLLVETCARWLEDASPTRRTLIEHALRSAIKRGDSDALSLLGFGKKAKVTLEDIQFHPKRVAIGGNVEFSFVLRSTAKSAQNLLVDFAVHFVRANKNTSAKVFKLKRVVLPALGRCEFSSKISFAIHTTRKPRVGRHEIDVLVNGEAMRVGSIEVVEGVPK